MRSILKTRPETALRIAAGPGEQLVDAGEQGVDADAARGRAEEHRVDDARAGLLRQARAQAAYDRGGSSSDVRAQDRLVVLGEDLGERLDALVGRVNGTVARGPGVADLPIGMTPGDSRRAIAGDDALRIGAGPVDLVDEDQRRDVEPLERAEQQRRLGLDALDRRDDEDRAVEHAEDALDLGDEVGVAGRVDEVDREVADEERGDRGPDRDAAFALELERVGLGGAGVDAADVVDGAGGEEESLGEGGLTGVDVGEDAEIERAHGGSRCSVRCHPASASAASSPGRPSRSSSSRTRTTSAGS